MVQMQGDCKLKSIARTIFGGSLTSQLNTATLDSFLIVSAEVYLTTKYCVGHGKEGRKKILKICSFFWNIKLVIVDIIHWQHDHMVCPAI